MRLMALRTLSCLSSPTKYVTGCFQKFLSPNDAWIVQPSRFAGHSHWQNVKGTKEAKDRIKATNSMFYQKAVTRAVKMGGGIKDPRLNSYLASVLAEAKSNSVPFSTLDRVLKADNTTDSYIIEVKAPGGLFILVESCAKPVSSERQRLASLVKKYGCSIAPTIGKISTEFFTHVGCIIVSSDKDSKIQDIDTATELGIEIGAHDVEEAVDYDGTVFKFHCDPQDVEKLRRALENDHGIIPLSAEDEYIPKSCVTIQKEARGHLDEMYEKIRDIHEYVDRIFDNVNQDGDKK